MNNQNNSRVAEYEYDYLGRRVKKIDYSGQNPETTRFYYDGDRIASESSWQTWSYVYGPGIDELVCMKRIFEETSEDFYYQYDPLGSVVAFSGNDSMVLERYSYDAFGKPTIYDADGNTISQSAYGNRFMFTGREYDSETGNYYYRARYYNPRIGRFLQTDPIWSVNLYPYCLNNPVNWIDPWGLARRQIRPLNMPGLRHITWGPSHHDSFRYNDGSNSGYYDDSTVRNDNAPRELQDRYKDVGSERDDATLQQAEKNVRPEWDRNTNPNATPYDKYKKNCQDYCDRVQQEYDRLQEEKQEDKDNDPAPPDPNPDNPTPDKPGNGDPGKGKPVGDFAPLGGGSYA